MEAARNIFCAYVFTALLIGAPWSLSYAHLVLLSVTNSNPVHFILNPGHIKYVLMVWNLDPSKIQTMAFHLQVKKNNY